MHIARLRIRPRLDSPLAPGTKSIRLWPIGGFGLPLQGLLEHLLSENFTNRQADIFQLSQPSPPRQPIWPINPIDERLCNALDVRLHRFDARGNLFLPGHPWLLKKSLALSRCENSQLPLTVYPPPGASCKPCRTPGESRANELSLFPLAFERVNEAIHATERFAELPAEGVRLLERIARRLIGGFNLVIVIGFSHDGLLPR